MEEIRLKTGGYHAEYGRSLGSIIDMVTKSGADTLEIDAFAFFTNDAITAAERPGLLAARGRIARL